MDELPPEAAPQLSMRGKVRWTCKGITCLVRDLRAVHGKHAIVGEVRLKELRLCADRPLSGLSCLQASMVTCSWIVHAACPSSVKHEAG
eukprot:4513177-Amphidinium_carterae.1